MLEEAFLWLVLALIHHAERDGVDELRAGVIFISLLCASLFILRESRCSTTSTKCTANDKHQNGQPVEKTLDDILSQEECNQIRRLLREKMAAEANNASSEGIYSTWLYGLNLERNETYPIRYGPSYVNVHLETLQGDKRVQNKVKMQRDILLLIHFVLLCVITYYNTIAVPLPKASKADEKAPPFNPVLLLDPVLTFHALVVYTAMRSNPGVTYRLLVYLALQAYALHDLLFPHQTSGVLSEFIGGPSLLLMFYVGAVYYTRNILPDCILYVIREYEHLGVIVVEAIFFLVYFGVGRMDLVLAYFGVSGINMPPANGKYDLAEQFLGFQSKSYCQFVLFVLGVMVPGLSVCTILKKTWDLVQLYQEVSSVVGTARSVMCAPFKYWPW